MRKLSVVFCAILLLATTVQAADNYLGTWILNVAKSKYDPGPAPKSQTTILETVAGGALKETVDRVNADNSKTHWELTAKFDGKDYPVTGDASRDAVSVKRIDDNTLEVTNKKAGKITNVMKLVVAKDGKTRTNEVQFTDAKGVKVHNVIFFDKK